VTVPRAHLSDEEAQRLLEGLFDEGEAASCATHAAECPECAELVESYRALSRRLEAMPLPDLPAGFTAAVLRAVGERERALSRERSSAALVSLGAAGALLLALVLGGNGAWVPHAARMAQELAALAGALRLGADLVPALFALRLPVAVLSALFALPLLLALFRLMASPRTESS